MYKVVFVFFLIFHNLYVGKESHVENYIEIASYVQKKGIILKFKFISYKSQQTCRPISDS